MVKYALPWQISRDLADEADEIGITRQHERVDQDAGLAARGDLGERLRDDERVEAEGVAVDAAVGPRQADGLPSVIITIWRMSFCCRSRIRRASRSPSRVLV